MDYEADINVLAAQLVVLVFNRMRVRWELCELLNGPFQVLCDCEIKVGQIQFTPV
jgi:hypothetical protein